MPWFKKEMPETPLYLPVGKPIRFEAVDFDYGYLRTEDGYLVTELRKCATRKVGGVTEITEEEYAEFEEKKGEGPLHLGLLRQRQSIGPQKQTRNASSSDVVAVSNRGEVIGRTADGRMVSDVATPQRGNGLQVNKQFSKPRIGQIPVTDD